MRRISWIIERFLDYWSFIRAGLITMKNTLEIRRRKLLRELDRINREIAFTRKSLTRIQCRIAAIQQPITRAA